MHTKSLKAFEGATQQKKVGKEIAGPLERQIQQKSRKAHATYTNILSLLPKRLNLAL